MKKTILALAILCVTAICYGLGYDDRYGGSGTGTIDAGDVTDIVGDLTAIPDNNVPKASSGKLVNGPRVGGLLSTVGDAGSQYVLLDPNLPYIIGPISGDGDGYYHATTAAEINALGGGGGVADACQVLWNSKQAALDANSNVIIGDMNVVRDINVGGSLRILAIYKTADFSVYDTNNGQTFCLLDGVTKDVNVYLPDANTSMLGFSVTFEDNNDSYGWIIIVDNNCTGYDLQNGENLSTKRYYTGASRAIAAGKYATYSSANFSFSGADVNAD